MTSDENRSVPNARPWVELGIAIGVAFVVSYGQRWFGSMTFSDTLHRLAAWIRPDHPPSAGLPREFVRDLYDSTR